MQELNPIQWAIRPFQRFADFSGRSPRAEYWWFYLVTLIVQVVLTMVDKVLGYWIPLSTVFGLATLVPWIAVTIRRLHDTDRSGWWLATFVLTFAAIGALAGFAAAIANRGSTAGSFTAAIVAIVVALILFATFIAFMVLPGTEGPNRYGPDPYGPDALEEVFA